MNRKGYALYGGVGPTTKGAGASVTYSPNDIKPHSTTEDFSVNKLGLSGTGSFPFIHEFVPFSEGEYPFGVATGGYSAMTTQTFSFHNWNDKSPYSFVQKSE